MSTDVVILGVGMATAVGLSAPETAASVRSRTMRFSATALRDKHFAPFTLAEIPEAAIPPLNAVLAHRKGLTSREARMLRLATQPLRECLTPLLSSAPSSVGLCLALPETETARPLDRLFFRDALAEQVGRAFDPRGSDFSHSGRAGGLIAIGQAVQTINSGRADFILAGGVDTFRDLYILATLDLEQRVKSASSLDGFIPGEGAGFILLGNASAASARHLTPLGRVSSVAMGFETGHLHSTEVYRGDGLASTFAQLLQLGAIEQPVTEVYSSMNGENHWAKEWGVGYMRNRAMFSPSHHVHHPADSFGDTGAACGPLMVGLAALSMHERSAGSPALVYGSSDRGARAAITVNAIH